ncbi:PAS domain-containing sensor histidine kinase [Actibacterium sp. 188UL27-1]|uniref:PAS domain-containing sensor histidine kinase n=1 Tax=Actibacterium sp. 188UL27-1 TaxID=2786961 RepID=UPI00195F06D6|nr:PAS domain-containing sensor histidine kinase [Actibacterium sp. 188UL27-1]MBM7068075.1 PAS domain-containing sensor histidine kinase [Actibacterium sp. 188UL27-1]
MATQIDPESLTWRVTPDLLGVLDTSGYFKRTNPAWWATLGLLPQDIESRQFFDFIHPEDLPKTEQAFVAIQQGQPILNFENRYRHKDGSYRWLSWNAVPEGDLFFCSARDITLSKVNAASLKTREQEARLRDQFTAVLGHDLRNPLAAVDAAMRLMRRQPQSQKSLEFLDIGEKSVHRISELIDNLMDFARVSLGQGLDIIPVDDCDLAPVIQQAVEELRLGNPDVTIIESYDLNRSSQVDPDRIGQLVSNLVGNAVAHGQTSLPIRVTATDTGDVISIAVENIGDPIPPDILPRLFEPFSRGNDPQAGKGLGLGLFIARQIAVKHGGDLSVASDAERTVFTFQMPVHLPAIAVND